MRCSDTAVIYFDDVRIPAKNIIGEEGDIITQYWRERAAFQRSAFGRSTAGNDVVATIFIRLFPFFFRFSPSRPFLIEGLLGSKNLFSESCLERPNLGVDTRPRPPFWGPLAAILDFAGDAALQAVSK